MAVHVLVPAAGSGSRMGTQINKQFLHLEGRPVLAHTLALFDNHPQITHISLISSPEEREYCRVEIVERFGFSRIGEIVVGGRERQDSVRNGLLVCGADRDDIVLIHDGARPLFSPDYIPILVRTAEETGACVLAVPVKDTLKVVEAGVVTQTPDRSRLWQVQTPQAFRYGLLHDAYERAFCDGFRGTDDASLVERLGHPVAVVEGDYRNIKVTTPEDMIVASALMTAAGEVAP